MAEDALVTRPDSEVRVRILPPLGYEFALSLREGATLVEAALGARRPRVRLRNPSRRTGRIRRRRLPHSRKPVMNADAWRANALAPSNPIARLTSAAFRPDPGMAPAPHLAPDAGAAVFCFRAHALGRLVHAVLRHEDPVLAGVQAPHLRRRNPVSDAGTGRGDGEHRRDRAADPARLRTPHPLGGARASCA